MAASVVVTGAVWALGRLGVGVHEYLAVGVALALMLAILAGMDWLVGRWVA